MNHARNQVFAAFAIFKRDALTFLSYRSMVASQLFGIVFSLTLFYYISRLVRVETFGSPDEYFAFVVIGMVIVQVLQATLALSGTVRGELLTGTFERMVVSPFGALGGIIGMILFPLTQAFALAALTLAGGALIFGISVAWGTAALAIPVALLGAMSFAAIGLLFVASVVVVKQTAAGVGFVSAGIAIISGLYFPISLLPSWIEWIAHVQPFTPAVDLLRHLLVGLPLTEPVWAGLLKLVGFAIVLLPLATLAVSAAVRHARRAGTIIEY